MKADSLTVQKKLALPYVYVYVCIRLFTLFYFFNLMPGLVLRRKSNGCSKFSIDVCSLTTLMATSFCIETEPQVLHMVTHSTSHNLFEYLEKLPIRQISNETDKALRILSIPPVLSDNPF